MKNEEERKNELVVQEENTMFDSNVKSYTTLDIDDENQADLLLNAMSDVDFKLNDCVGQVIECVGCYATEREVESVDENTGEVITRKKHTLILFDKDGKSYVTGSNACYNSFATICNIKRRKPTLENHMNFQVIKTSAKQAGHSYLRLKLVKASE